MNTANAVPTPGGQRASLPAGPIAGVQSIAPPPPPVQAFGAPTQNAAAPARPPAGAPFAQGPQSQPSNTTSPSAMAAGSAAVPKGAGTGPSHNAKVAAVLVVLVLAIGLLAWFIWKSQTDKQAAEEARLKAEQEEAQRQAALDELDDADLDDYGRPIKYEDDDADLLKPSDAALCTKNLTQIYVYAHESTPAVLITELEAFDAHNAPLDLKALGTITANHSTADGAAKNAIDGDLTTYWKSDHAVIARALSYNFKAPTPVHAVRIRSTKEYAKNLANVQVTLTPVLGQGSPQRYTLNGTQVAQAILAC